MSENILITGGSGFLGTNILNKIYKIKKYKINSTFFKKKNFQRFKNVKYQKANLLEESTCMRLCKNMDTVIMCAAVSSGAKIINKEPLIHFKPNIIMNLNMINAANLNKVKRFIFISSSVVYPLTNKFVVEKDVNYKFFEKYFVSGWMKIFSEITCEIFSKKKYGNLNFIILRPSNLYGPYDKFDHNKSKVIPSLIRKFLENKKKIIVLGDGKDLKDFLYIDDFVDALVKILNRKKIINKTFNIASGFAISIKDLIKYILQINCNYSSKVIFNKRFPKMIPYRNINIEKIKKEINFSPRVSLYEGLKRTITWYKNQQ